MLKSVLGLVLLFTPLFCQNNSYHSPENIKIFADYLFCQKDYLRAIEEFKRLDNFILSDTILFKIGKSYLQMGDNDLSIKYFDLVEKKSLLKSSAVNHNSLNYFFKNDLISLKNNIRFNSELSIEDSKRLLVITSILNENLYPSNDELQIFDDSEKSFVNEIIKRKKFPDYKSPLTAGVLSLIPGLGKVYTKNYSDGLTSFLLTGLFTFLAYDNFNNSHQFRGYVFSLAAIGFYLGGIYGSVASAFQYNRYYDEKLITETNEFLRRNNYFIKDVNFCE